MQGYVLAFRPDTCDGTIIADSGEAVRFAHSSSRAELHGGDIVRFHVGDGGESKAACDVEIVERWPDRLKACHRSHLETLHATLEMDSPVS